jgi:Quinolinate phosphoribosyl transferase, C-terminal domain
LDHRLTNRQKIALWISKENFARLDFARFRRLSTAIGRFFSVCRRLIDTWSSKKDRREATYRLVKIEVEVDTRAQLQKALDVDAALLDNISPDVLKRGVAMVRRPRYQGVSGRVMHETASAIAERAS